MQIRDLEYWYYKVVEWRSEIRIKILDDNNLTSFLNSEIKGKQNKTVSKSKGDKGFLKASLPLVGITCKCTMKYNRAIFIS